jgi:high affinity Mn2+ porin
MDRTTLRLFLAFLILAPCHLCAQGASPESSAANQESFWNRFWLSVQGNVIRQQHQTFGVEYSGPNSFLPDGEHATSRIETLYTGFRITKRLEILADVESAGGGGLSSALGIAGFPNVDVVRNPTLGQDPYVSRVCCTIPSA